MQQQAHAAAEAAALAASQSALVASAELPALARAAATAAAGAVASQVSALLAWGTAWKERCLHMEADLSAFGRRPQCQQLHLHLPAFLGSRRLPAPQLPLPRAAVAALGQEPTRRHIAMPAPHPQQQRPLPPCRALHRRPSALLRLRSAL